MYGKIKVLAVLMAGMMLSVISVPNNASAAPQELTVLGSGTSGSTTGPICVYAAVYNVSELEKDRPILGGVYNWRNSVTYGMIAALDGKEFTLNGKTYQFKTTIVDYHKIVNGILDEKLDNGELKYKLFVAPGDYDYLLDQIFLGLNSPVTDNKYIRDMMANPLTASTFRQNIKNFVANGGGYVGTCGGASFACKSRAFGPGLKYTTPGTYLLGMVDATATSRALHEDQYASKGEYNVNNYAAGDWEDWGGIPVPTQFVGGSNIFPDIDKYIDTSYGSSIRYWGGSAFVHPGPSVNVIAKYNKEPGNDSSLQLHRFGSNEVISTTLLHNPAIVSTTYGNGRVIIFGNHPELKSWKYGTGHVVEDSLHTKYLYASNTNGEKFEPKFDTRGIILDSAKWAVQPALTLTDGSTGGGTTTIATTINEAQPYDDTVQQTYATSDVSSTQSQTIDSTDTTSTQTSSSNELQATDTQTASSQSVDNAVQ